CVPGAEDLNGSAARVNSSIAQEIQAATRGRAPAWRRRRLARGGGVEIGDGLNRRGGRHVEALIMDEAPLVLRPERIGVPVEVHDAAVSHARTIPCRRD